MTSQAETAATIAPPEPDLTQEEIVQRARDLVPVLRERQALCEELRRLPDETSRDFIEAGFYRILQPRRFGGYEFDLPTFAKVTMALARGCPSSGWTYALVAGHAHMFSALWPEHCQIDVYGENGDFRMPGNVRFGSATKVDGGYRMTGAWDYVSGCDSATHFVLAAEVPSESEGAEPERFTCVVDADQCEIVDNWYVHGLRGSGSKRVTAEDVFVPAYRTIGGMFHSDLRAAPAAACTRTRSTASGASSAFSSSRSRPWPPGPRAGRSTSTTRRLDPEDDVAAADPDGRPPGLPPLLRRGPPARRGRRDRAPRHYPRLDGVGARRKPRAERRSRSIASSCSRSASSTARRSPARRSS